MFAKHGSCVLGFLKRSPCLSNPRPMEPHVLAAQSRWTARPAASPPGAGAGPRPGARGRAAGGTSPQRRARRLVMGGGSKGGEGS